MKIIKSTFILLAIFLIANSCEKLGNSDKDKEYKVSVVLETQVYRFQYFNQSNFAVYLWENSGSSSYELYANNGDNIEVDFPGIVTVSDGGAGKISVVFNENGSGCNIKNLEVKCGVGGSGRSSYENNKCGRTRMSASVSGN